MNLSSEVPKLSHVQSNEPINFNLLPEGLQEFIFCRRADSFIFFRSHRFLSPSERTATEELQLMLRLCRFCHSKLLFLDGLTQLEFCPAYHYLLIFVGLLVVNKLHHQPQSIICPHVQGLKRLLDGPRATQCVPVFDTTINCMNARHDNFPLAVEQENPHLNMPRLSWVEIWYTNNFSYRNFESVRWPVQPYVMLILLRFKTPQFFNFFEFSFRKIIPWLQAHRWSDFALALKLRLRARSHVRLRQLDQQLEEGLFIKLETLLPYVHEQVLRIVAFQHLTVVQPTH